MRRIWATAFAVVLGSTMLAGCGSTTMAGGSGKCAMDANNPHESTGSPGWIVGKARFGCDVAADSVTAEVVLQQYVSGNWVTRASGTRTVGPVAVKKGYTVQATYPCRSGKFRTGTRGFGYLRGIKSKSTAWDYSSSVVDPC